MAHELERNQWRGFLDELDQIHGPIPKTELARARRAWPIRGSSEKSRIAGAATNKTVASRG
jgi:hypothetical protein